ncbi:MAG: Flp pilus assembly protein CpaB [Phycisphaerae bacterium]|nr:Flp pilus assembly protein CpaB [Phycisphaerae bacterium]
MQNVPNSRGATGLPRPRMVTPSVRAGQRNPEGTRMMNGKAVIPLVAGLCIGGFALKMVFDTVKKAKGASTNMTQVYAAAQDIALGTRISAEMVKPLAFPTAAVPPGAFTKKEKLIGRVARTFTVAGLPIVDGMLHPEGAPSGLVVKEGFRAVAVKIDDSSGVDNHLWPGCFVDVVGYFNIRQNGKQQTIARTIIENVEVAAVGQRISLVEATTPGEKPKKQAPARAVTLFVKPSDVPTLHLAEQRGKLKLSMRNSMDDGKPSEEGQLAVNESKVTGVKTEEPEKPKTDTPNPMSGFLAGLFSKNDQKADEPVKPVVQEPVAELPPAKPGFTTVVYRGASVEEVQWKDRHSRERFNPQPAAPAGPAAPAPPAADSHTPQKNKSDSVQSGPQKNDEHPVSPEETDSVVEPAPEAEPQEIDG